MNDDVKMGRFLSLVLRHKPQAIGIELDKNGWASVEELLAKMRQHGKRIDRDQLDRIVANNNKQRYAFSGDGTKIRASQGHSLNIDLNLSPSPPPDVLYHGTAAKNLASIKVQGLQRQSRQHVHLSGDRQTATAVGRRHGKPVVLVVKSGEMHARGALFYQSENGVWLTGEVKPEFLLFPG